MEKIIIIAVLAIILIVIITILIVEYNKFQWQIIKVNKGEVNIIDSLEKKYHIVLYLFYQKRLFSIVFHYYLNIY